MDDPRYRISSHALIEAERRGISSSLLRHVLESPDQIIQAHSGRSAYQAVVTIDAKPYLVRAIVEQGDPLVVITVYRTSKLEKYWSNEP